MAFVGSAIAQNLMVYPRRRKKDADKLSQDPTVGLAQDLKQSPKVKNNSRSRGSDAGRDAEKILQNDAVTMAITGVARNFNWGGGANWKKILDIILMTFFGDIMVMTSLK